MKRPFNTPIVDDLNMNIFWVNFCRSKTGYTMQRIYTDLGKVASCNLGWWSAMFLYCFNLKNWKADYKSSLLVTLLIWPPAKIMLAVVKILFSVQMIASFDGDVKQLALAPSSSHITCKRMLNNPWNCSKRVGEVGHSVVVYLTCAVIGLGGRGKIQHGLKQLHSAPLHVDVRSHLSGFSALQVRRVGTVDLFIYLFILRS